jgi:hypothetical protein
LADGSVAVANSFADQMTLGSGTAGAVTFTNQDDAADSWVAKFDPSGAVAWAKHISGSAEVSVFDVSGAADGSVWLLVQFRGTTGQLVVADGASDAKTVPMEPLDFALARFSPTGTLGWVTRFAQMGDLSISGITASARGAVAIGSLNGSALFGAPSGPTLGPTTGNVAFAALVGP